MKQPLAIETKELVKHYGEVRALQGLDLEVRQGEIFGFLGPNGAGKTTTIRCLLDLIRPSAGQISVLGLDPQRQPLEVRSQTGYLPGELHLFEGLKVRRLLEYFDRLRGKRTQIQIIAEMAERLNLDLDTKIKNLSKGNKQKVGIVLAFMHKPRLLVLDEPTAGLDPLVQREVLLLVREAQGQGATVFFSSHVLSEVEEIAERVAIIRQGKLVEVASVTNLLDRALHRVRIRFLTAVDLAGLDDLPGVRVLAKRDAVSTELQVAGEMDQLVKTLADYPVATIETERPSLEEAFLVHYRN